MGLPEASKHRRNESGHLSVSFKPTPERTSSPASSARTKVSEIAPLEKIQPPRRQQTQVIDINKLPSWWGIFKIFISTPGRKKLKKKLLKILMVDDTPPSHEGQFDDKECPYILTVNVFPNDSASDPVKANCTLDTGCFQGNIISDTLARRLGFTEYQPLSEKESNGGQVATGGIHQVVGAIHVSWHHFTSPRIFHGMRFLVSETADVDLVIGTESIVNHNLVAPPNLGLHAVIVDSNLSKEKLTGDEAKRKTALKAAERELKALDTNSPDRSQKEKVLQKKQKQHRLAELELALYVAHENLETAKKPAEEQALEAKIANLKREKANLKHELAKEHKDKGAKGKKEAKI